MEILLALIFGAAAGGVLHYIVAGRATRGTALGPVLGALLGGVTWLIFTWAGVTMDNPWIWIVSIVVPVVIVPLVLLGLAQSRATHDAAERVRLRIS
jgi:hypothetical protein